MHILTLHHAMNIYLLSQDEATGYDTYDACVVAAESAEDAVAIHPGYNDGWPTDRFTMSAWASKPENVTTILLGLAVEGTERGVILASFNAG
jgi:hypothetical protein